MTKRTYITIGRLNALRRQLSPYDLAILGDVDRLGLVTGDQLARLHYGTSSSDRRLARLHLARLSDVRVLGRLGRRIGGVRAGSAGYVYALDLAGQRLVDPERRRTWPRSTPGEAFLAHFIEVAELYVDLRLAERAGELTLVVFDTEPVCWRSYGGPGGGRLVVKPDAYVVVAADGWEQHHFVEVDRATESVPRILTKAKIYGRYFQSGREQATTGLFPQVLWVVPTIGRATAITSALSALPAEQWELHRVCLADDALAALAGEPIGGVA